MSKIDENPFEFDKPTKDLADLGLIGFWEYDFTLEIVHASPDVERLFSVYDGTIGGHRAADYEANMYPSDVAWLRAARPLCVGPSGHGVLEYCVIDGAGHVRWILCRAKYQTGADGSILSGRGAIFDITVLNADGIGVRSPLTGSQPHLHRLIALTIEAYSIAENARELGVVNALAAALMEAGRSLALKLRGNPTGAVH